MSARFISRSHVMFLTILVLCSLFVSRLWLATGKAMPVDPLISDQTFVFHPNHDAFDIEAFLRGHDSGLLAYHEVHEGEAWSAVEIIEHTARYYSINPQVLLALIELRSGAVTSPQLDQQQIEGMFGFDQGSFQAELSFAAGRLFDAYYGHKIGNTAAGAHRPQGVNAGTVALMTYYDAVSRDAGSVDRILSHEKGSFFDLFQSLFGDPLAGNMVNEPPPGHMRGARLPWLPGKTWNYNSGPHNHTGGTLFCGWQSSGCPPIWSAVDFGVLTPIYCSDADQGSVYSAEWAAAARPGEVLAFKNTGEAVIDHKDGWKSYYVHLSQEGLVKPGSIGAGDPVGHPSCQGKTSGVHLHFSVNYKGEFQQIDGLNLGGWTVHRASTHYNGTLVCPDGRHKSASTARVATSSSLMTAVQVLRTRSASS